VHFDRGHHSRGHTLFFERVLKREGVDHRGEHPHVVRRHAIHVLSRGRHAAKKVPATYYEANLNAAASHFGNFSRQCGNTRRIHAEGPFARQHLTAYFEENASVFCHGFVIPLLESQRPPNRQP
jgi:hypothetical protein